MPELPEVQTIVNDLIAARLIGTQINSVRVHWPRSIAGTQPRQFSRRIRHAGIYRIWRRAKYIVLELDHGNTCLLIHLRMSGRLNMVPVGTPRDRHEHVCIELSDGRELRLHDTRKFARVQAIDNAAAVFDRLGPEPLDSNFTLRVFNNILNRARMLKPLLLDQRAIAGLGNIYVDEALWESGLHPCRAAHTLVPAERKKLLGAIVRVLKRGLRNLGTTLGTGKTNFFSVAGRKGDNSTHLRVFRKTGLPCPRCTATIERIVVAQRSTHICPVCQQLPRNLRV